MSSMIILMMIANVFGMGSDTIADNVVIVMMSVFGVI